MLDRFHLLSRGSVTGTVDFYSTNPNAVGTWAVWVDERQYCTGTMPIQGNARPISCRNLPAGKVALESGFHPGGGIHHLTLSF